MAVSKVTFIREDGNLNTLAVGSDYISGMLFDIPSATTMPTNLKLGTVYQVFSVNEAIALGITEYSTTGTNFFYGIPYYHISEYFRMKPNGSLYLLFADCTSNWEAIRTIQAGAQGTIGQLGIWTPKNLWSAPAGESDPYTLNIVADINAMAEKLAGEHRPLSVLLTANTITADSTKSNMKINLTRIPTCISDCQRVSVFVGQGKTSALRAMQIANTDHSTIGCVGTALGCVSKAKVDESIAWVDQFNLYGTNYANIEFGFGDATLSNDGKDFTSMLSFEALTPAQVDELDEKGYIFPLKYSGRSNGTYFSKDRTCSTGDYRTIARNRTIDKSRRGIRNALLPYLNAPVLVNPSNGYLAELEIKKYQNVVDNVLTAMKGDTEISGYSISIPTNQNVIQTDMLKITYAIVPVGISTDIEVTEGFEVSQG